MQLLYLEPLPRQATKSDLLAWLGKLGGLDRRRVGRIELRGKQATIEIPDDWQSRLVKALDGQMLGQRRVRVWVGTSAQAGCADDDHFQRLSRLLELESQAEAQEVAERGRRLSPAEAQRTGTSLVNLVITDEDTGPGRPVPCATRKAQAGGVAMDSSGRGLARGPVARDGKGHDRLPGRGLSAR